MTLRSKFPSCPLDILPLCHQVMQMWAFSKWGLGGLCPHSQPQICWGPCSLASAPWGGPVLRVCAPVGARVPLCVCAHVGRGCPWLLQAWEHQAPLFCGAACDLSPCLLSGNIRISDLGLAVELKDGQTKTKGYAGTPG